MREFRIIYDPSFASHGAQDKSSAHHELIGYPLPNLHAQPGFTISLAVSTTEDAFTCRIVRLLHGDVNKEGPGHVFTVLDDSGTRGSGLDGLRKFNGGLQEIRGGSWGVVDLAKAGYQNGSVQTVGCYIWPTIPGTAGHEQVVLARDGGKVVIEASGCLAFEVDGTRISIPSPLKRKTWYFVAASIDVDGKVASLACLEAHDKRAKPVLEQGELKGGCTADNSNSGWTNPKGSLYLASPPNYSAQHLYNGKISAPFALSEPLSPELLDSLILTPPDPFELTEPSTQLFGAPTTLVTSHLWKYTTTDPRLSPNEYKAVHFHEDDLDEAFWEPNLIYQIPEDLPSGIYAFRIDAEMTIQETGEKCSLWDEIPFFVSSPTPDPTKPLFIIPTLTYQVYSNERLISAGAENGQMTPPDSPFRRFADPADLWLARHPECGGSGYDTHKDGSGVQMQSLRRPVPNIRGGFKWWITGATERFGADLYLNHFLAQNYGTSGYHVLTDHELNAKGRAALDGYRCVLFGSHPEYWSPKMRFAFQEWLEDGGRGMYLGGNGFYWITTISETKPHLCEIRRANTGTRCWSSPPGERHHSTTLQPGGLWKEFGLPPNAICGVGFCGESDSWDKAAGYARTEESYLKDLSWVFDGCTEGQVFGEYGLFLGGAAGYEIDRFDTSNGSPEETIVLATSAGRQPASYLLSIEDMQSTLPEIHGQNCEKVRSDVVLVPVGKGWMFSVGSCSWVGSLFGKGGKGDVGQITGNVLRKFLGDGDLL